MNDYYIYVDDIREDDSWFNKHFRRGSCAPFVCRSYESTIHQLEEILNAEPQANIFLDLDHDLGELEWLAYSGAVEKTGYDICSYVIENRIKLSGFRIHSMNPVGAERMRQALSRAGYREFF